jgi:hypothetical protein
MLPRDHFVSRLLNTLINYRCTCIPSCYLFRRRPKIGDETIAQSVVVQVDIPAKVGLSEQAGKEGGAWTAIPRQILIMIKRRKLILSIHMKILL